MKYWNKHSIKARCWILLMVSSFIFVLPTFATNANAIAIDVLTGKDLATAAEAELIAEGIKLATQAGAIIPAVLKGEAWTWDYAFAFPKEDTKFDTTLTDDPAIAYAKAEAKGWFGRHAIAEGFANKKTGNIHPFAKTNRLAVAKSIAGVGDKFETDGARAAALILAKIINIALDPEPQIPDSLVLDTVNGLGPSGFWYDVELTDPSGQKSSLFSVTGQMIFDSVIDDWTLQINDPTNTLSVGHFSRSVGPGGIITYNLTAPVEFTIPFQVSNSWPSGSTFVIDTKGGVIAESVDPVPEPSTLLLLGSGLVGIIVFGRKRLFKKV